jgi:hypothetical protein
MSTHHWPFEHPPDAVAVSDASVVDDGEAVLVVIHSSEDQGWLFLSGGPLSPERMRTIRMDRAIEFDPTLLGIADLPPGWTAERDSGKGAWLRKRPEPLVEFLIRRTDPEGKWVDVHMRDMAKVFTPRSVSAEVIQGMGHLRLRLLEIEVSITFEDPGVQVSFFGSVDPHAARAIVDEMASSVCRHTGQTARIIEL